MLTDSLPKYLKSRHLAQYLGIYMDPSRRDRPSLDLIKCSEEKQEVRKRKLGTILGGELSIEDNGACPRRMSPRLLLRAKRSRRSTQKTERGLRNTKSTASRKRRRPHTGNECGADGTACHSSSIQAQKSTTKMHAHKCQKEGNSSSTAKSPNNGRGLTSSKVRAAVSRAMSSPASIAVHSLRRKRLRKTTE